MELNRQELQWVHRALLEVITGGGDIMEWELPIRIGGTKEELDALHTKINAALSEPPGDR